MAEFTIRRAGEADRASIQLLAEMLQDAEHEMHPSRRPGAALEPAFLDDLIGRTGGDTGAIVVAERAGEIAGYVAFYAEHRESLELRESAFRFLYVSDLCVVPEMRGLGVAGRLLAEAERCCRRLGLPRLAIGVLAANGAARAAYRRAGYVPYELWLDKHISRTLAPVRPVAGLMIRPMTVEDRELMLRFLRGLADDEAACHWAMRPGVEMTMREVDRTVREIASDDGAIAIAELDGDAVGYVGVVCENACDEFELRDDWMRRGFVTDMYVAPEGRRRGIALALLREAERHVTGRGLDWLHICVSPENAPAIALYEKAGFTPYELVLEKKLG
jgi:ribosomal protein S18 acetylase RimI-like enzyme